MSMFEQGHAFSLDLLVVDEAPIISEKQRAELAASKNETAVRVVISENERQISDIQEQIKLLDAAIETTRDRIVDYGCLLDEMDTD